MAGPGLNPNSSQGSDLFPKLNSTIGIAESLYVSCFSLKHHPPLRKLKVLFVRETTPRVKKDSSGMAFHG